MHKQKQVCSIEPAVPTCGPETHHARAIAMMSPNGLSVSPYRPASGESHSRGVAMCRPTKS